MSNQKWEYLVKKYKEDNLEEELNKLGKIGWELISIQNEQTKYICVFKRLLKQVSTSKPKVDKAKQGKDLIETLLKDLKKAKKI
tara:strand:+ start:382 stop:633 length:252 start_codon:yes stop_codon:yes gene_type:complete